LPDKSKRVTATVTSVNLALNKIKDEGITRLADALKHNKSVSELHLYDNGFGDVGAEALAGALRVNASETQVEHAVGVLHPASVPWTRSAGRIPATSASTHAEGIQVPGGRMDRGVEWTFAKQRSLMAKNAASPSKSPSSRIKAALKRIKGKAKSRAELELKVKKRTERDRQLDLAFEAHENEVKTSGATGAFGRTLNIAKERNWNLVTKTTFMRRLQARATDAQASRSRTAILTPHEEDLLVQYIRMKNLAAQALSRKEIRDTILKLLARREMVNAAGGSRPIPLSTAAQQALDTGNIGKSFWVRFYTTHPTLKQGTATKASRKRTGACTRETAQAHLDGLAAELKAVGIMDEDGFIVFPERIFNADETPQFMNYGSSPRTATCTGEKGGAITKYTEEARVSVTLTPFISLDGKCPLLQVIWQSAYVTAETLSKSIFDKFRSAGTRLLQSAAAKGYQTGASWLHALKAFDEYLDKEKIQRPVVLMLDGHASRFDIDVLRFCREKQIHVFLSPPDTTGLTQPLDQINAALHGWYDVQTGKWQAYVQNSLLLARRRKETRADLGAAELDLELDDEGEASDDDEQDSESHSDAGSDDEGRPSTSAGEASQSRAAALRAELLAADADAADCVRADGGASGSTDVASRPPAPPRKDYRIGKKVFINLMGDIWADWAKPSSISNAFRRCGVDIDTRTVSIDFMQHDKFALAERMLNRGKLANVAPALAAAPAAEPAAPPSGRTRATAPPPPAQHVRVPVPEGVRFGSAAFWKHKYEQEQLYSRSVDAILEHNRTLPSLPVAEDEDIFGFDIVATKAVDGRKRKSSRFGSVEGNKYLEDEEARISAEAAEATRVQADAEVRAARKREREEQQKEKDTAKALKKQRFLQCKAAWISGILPCACGAATAEGCESKALHHCEECGAVQKTACQKARCKAARAARVSAPPAPAAGCAAD